MKKLIAIVLALMLVLSLSVTAFATGAEGGTQETQPSQGTQGTITNTRGSITIRNLQVAEGTSFKYDIYRILDLYSFDTSGDGAYSYKINSDWAGFFAEGSAAWNYVNQNESGYITWRTDVDDSKAAEFAQLAINYAKANESVKPVKSSANEGEFVVKDNNGTFSDLILGYYLIDSDVGALCGLSTTNPNGSIVAKNGIPTIDKKVKEDSTDTWGAYNSADIGQTLEFSTTINVHAGAQNYKLHDTMTHMTFEGVTLVTLNGHTVPATETITVDGTQKTITNYTVSTTPSEDCKENCTFEVAFEPDFVKTLKTNDKLVVYYNAKLTADAVVGGNNNNGDKGSENKTHLEFGEHKTTTHDGTNTYTYAFDLAKTTSQNFLLDGASFKLYRNDTDDDADSNYKEVFVTKETDKDGKVFYRRAAEGATTGDIIEVTGGLVRIVGLDNGKYALREEEAPEGYNKIETLQKFTIADGNLDVTMVDKDGKQEVVSGSGVQVVNKAGTMLPETGAMGTTMFVTFGSFLALICGVLLITKKRMTMIEE